MAAALDIEFELFLANIIGFDASKRNCMIREGYINYDTLVYWKSNTHQEVVWWGLQKTS